MPSVLIHTLGCKLNQLESEAVGDAFSKNGFDLYERSDANQPDIIIVNTCTVTSKADQKARRVIRKTLRDFPASKVIVTGCYAELEKDALLKLGSAGERQRLFVLKGGEKNLCLELPRLIKENNGNIPENINVLNDCLLIENGEGKNVFQFLPEKFHAHTRAFLKIQDGCDRHCTYCRIRLARGKSISLDSKEVLSRLLVFEKNHGEAVLTGVNICRYYDKENDINLTRLLEILLGSSQKINIRLSSLDPEFINCDFAGALSHARIRPHFHLSVQSASDAVLKKMGRAYGRETLEKAVFLLRSVRNDPFLACDIIAGFPGESEEEFEKTYDFCAKNDFAWIHVFPYSKRPGTEAWSFKDGVKEADVEKRVKALTDLARKGRADYTRRWLGREVDVIVEKSDKKKCGGITENYLKVMINRKGEKPESGTVIRCKLSEIAGNDEFDAAAEMVK